jgi:hypothetical protein
MTDPSVIYGLELSGRWRGAIYQSDLKLNTPYNTYLHTGLPPGPVANPGLRSLRAAMTPAKTDYLYFVAAGANPQGGSLFSSTIEEHARNVAVTGTQCERQATDEIKPASRRRRNPRRAPPAAFRMPVDHAKTAHSQAAFDHADSHSRRVGGAAQPALGRARQSQRHRRIQASVLKTTEGTARDYTTFRGHILIRKPEMLRVLGQVPVLGTRMFDMASDGKNFTLFIPSKSLAVKGANDLRKKSASQIENMRPGFFFDAMVVRGLEPDDLYAVVADSETVEDAARKHLFTVPEYVLSISRRKPGTNELTPVRVVTFRRDDLMPYQQDIYDSAGNLETR